MRKYAICILNIRYEYKSMDFLYGCLGSFN